MQYPKEKMTLPKPKSLHQSEIFRIPLLYACWPGYPLGQLDGLIPWEWFEGHFGELYCLDNGRPSLLIRMIVDLLVKHARGLSDKEVGEWWLDSQYAQCFCGETQLDASSLLQFPIRIGESGCELILKSTVIAGALKKSDLNLSDGGTTVQEKTVTYLTDAKLLNRVRERLLKKARAAGLKFRRCYVIVSPKRLMKVNRYAHARQMKVEVKKLRTVSGRVMWNVEHKTGKIANPCIQQLTESKLASGLDLAKCLIEQENTSKNKVYSLHTPNVKFISKGKARKRYEFSVKVRGAVINRNNFVLGGLAFSGYQYEGHTLAISQAERIIGKKPQEVFWDRDHRGHGLSNAQKFIPSQKHWVKALLKRLYKRRQEITLIGHIKNDILLGRNYQKGSEGDQINATSSCIGCNMRIIMKKIMVYCANFLHRAGKTNFFHCFPERFYTCLKTA